MENGQIYVTFSKLQCITQGKHKEAAHSVEYKPARCPATSGASGNVSESYTSRPSWLRAWIAQREAQYQFIV